MKETVTYEWPMDWSKLRKQFIAVFHTTIVDFYDPFLSCLMGKFQIDIIKFDDFLHRKYGDYEKENLSMRDIIKREFGDAGLNLIEQLI